MQFEIVNLLFWNFLDKNIRQRKSNKHLRHLKSVLLIKCNWFDGEREGRPTRCGEQKDQHNSSSNIKTRRK